MAMVRTIKHPGIQIQETQIGSYSSNVTMNNTAYIMGFSDRGPIYDYSWIMNKSDFTKIYGQPQTEAEKYLFTAVESVLANGGTPIVARMPYDCKQCQSYKALKLTWELPGDYDQFTGILSGDNPIFPLSAVAQPLNQVKPLSATFVNGNVTYAASPSSVVPQAELNGLTLSSFLTMLSPYVTDLDQLSGEAGISGHLRPGFQAVNYLINGTAPSSLQIPNGVINSCLTGNINEYTDSTEATLSGDVFLSSVISGTGAYDKKYKVSIQKIELVSAVLDLEISQLQKKGIPLREATCIYSLANKLKYIYNDYAFFKNESASGSSLWKAASLDANLLMTTQMGYKYGLFLNSQDVEISNDQYDDLVTVNQFKAVDKTTSKYGTDIDKANFIVVDKQKTVVTGTENNIGYFITVIDPFDALKAQRLLVTPHSNVSTPVWSDNNGTLDYWAGKSYQSWNDIYETLLDQMDTIRKVRTADGYFIGDSEEDSGNLLNSWSVPLTGDYYTDSVSKTMMKKFPSIPMADINSDLTQSQNYTPAIIDHEYSTHIMIAVCNTYVDQSTGRIGINIAQTFFGSLFDQKNPQTGKSLFIGDIINSSSEFIEFYKNTFVASAQGAYDPPEYQRTAIPQLYLRDSAQLKNAALMRGIDIDEYVWGLQTSEQRKAGQAKYEAELRKYKVFIVEKAETCIYNFAPEANFTSFSKKESQKIIANTTGLTGSSDGTTINVAKNFLVDMDRCINFIKNRDDVPLTFVCDAGLTTIAQFCDNVTWNPNKRTKTGYDKAGNPIFVTTGGWVTQPFNPDDDPNSEDRYITSYADIATWRKVAEKISSICSDLRKDCFAIIDAPRQLTLDGAAPKIRRSKFDNKFDKTIGKCLRYITGFNTSYAAGYYNWLRTTDQYTGVSYWIPPTTKIIGNYCYLNIANLPWLAPAGLSYGVITGCHAISHNPNYQQQDQIYMKSWNYIKQYPSEGFVVEGQRTLLGKESVFERINVRLLFLDLQRFAYNVSRTFKYQVNNAYTRQQFVATLKPKFEDYTLRGGIYQYLIKVDSQNNTAQTIDNNQLRGDIFIKPARLIQFVLLNFVGTTTGTDFNQLPMG